MCIRDSTEAVAIRRRLAEANPAAYLPDLAMSLNNLSVQQANTRHPAINEAWHAAIDAMGQPAARAELRTAWVRLLNSSQQLEYAYDQLRQAAAEADTPVANPSDRSAIILTMRARQAVRSLAQELRPPAGDDLPI